MLITALLCIDPFNFIFAVLSCACHLPTRRCAVHHRVFLVSVEPEENRGQVVAAGGGRCLIPLASEGTVKGKRLAAQSIARIAITTNPVIAFPGQRVRDRRHAARKRVFLQTVFSQIARKGMLMRRQ